MRPLASTLIRVSIEVAPSGREVPARMLKEGGEGHGAGEARGLVKPSSFEGQVLRGVADAV